MMGLDLALAVVVVTAAFRGWFQGFLIQIVRIASLIACVYLADRVRDYAKPYVVPYLATIQPDLVDRLLWWVSAVVTYIVLVAASMLVIKMTRRPVIPGISEPGRNDQFAGFLVGTIKGAVIAAFLAGGIERYGADQVKMVPWAGEQVKASWAMQWTVAYQPVPRIWASRPVRHFVNHVTRMGIQKPGDPSQLPAAPGDGTEPLFRTASRPGDVERPSQDRTDLKSASSSSLPAESAVVDPNSETRRGGQIRVKAACRSIELRLTERVRSGTLAVQSGSDVFR